MCCQNLINKDVIRCNLMSFTEKKKWSQNAFVVSQVSLVMCKRDATNKGYLNNKCFLYFFLLSIPSATSDHEMQF